MPLRKEETKTPTATLQKSPKPHLKQPALANAVLAFPLPLPYNTSHLLCHSSLHRYSNTETARRLGLSKLCHSSLHRYSNTGVRPFASLQSFATVHFTGTATPSMIGNCCRRALPQFTSQVQQHRMRVRMMRSAALPQFTSQVQQHGHAGFFAVVPALPQFTSQVQQHSLMSRSRPKTLCHSSLHRYSNT